MKRWNIYTPEGVQDILFDDCRKKRALESGLRRVLALNGYRELETPTFEFYDVFAGDGDLIKQESLYKFCDTKGRLLALRCDMTVPVARVAATKLREDTFPLKCFYIGNTFSFDQLGGGKQNEFTQAGCEILGINSPEADAECVAMAIKAIRATGIEEFQIDIGQVAFFKGLMEETGLLPDEAEAVRELIDLKDFVGVEQILIKHQVKEQIKRILLDLPGLFGTKDILGRIDEAAIGKKASDALANLRTVLEILEERGLSRYVSVDLGMVQSLNYYTGLVFRGYTYGVGFPVLSGGRYDNLISRFGMDCPATGFSMGINLILMALDRQKKNGKHLPAGAFILYAAETRKEAGLLCDSLIEKGVAAELDMGVGSEEKAREYAKAKGYEKIIRVEADGAIREVLL